MKLRSKRSASRALLAAVASLTWALACKNSSPGEPEPSPPPTPVVSRAPPVAEPPRFILAPSELAAVEPLIQEQVELSLTTGGQTLVYVGAPWCEPCQRFHAAVLRGELDSVLAGTRLIEFDAEHHNAALHRAGYAYELIPVIAIPDSDGRSSGRLLSGSIKGPAAVTSDLVPRLRALLDGRAVE